MGDPLDLDAGESTWARYAKGTAGRDPMKFFHRAVEVTQGDDGSGRLVVDLGSGAGNEALAFLERGWTVHAVDGEPAAIALLLSRVPDEASRRLTTEVSFFHEMDIPQADLVFASLSLPFSGDHLGESMKRATEAVRPGGWFVGVLFGHNDGWAHQEDVAPVDVETIKGFLSGFDDLEIEEEEFDGPSSVGEKHWHWYVVAARRALVS